MWTWSAPPGRPTTFPPVPTVFILDRTGKIVFVHADPAYEVRMKGAEVLAAAKTAATISDAVQK
ncbi:MAG TPA: hypothetical protein VE242_07850 [Chthoniobacterales bacterium]|nr:hypothetical protein [Chthoniobacterales bacterium]